jgi:hypothetical protein
MVQSSAKGQQTFAKAKEWLAYKDLKEDLGSGSFGKVDKVKRRADGKVCAATAVIASGSQL